MSSIDCHRSLSFKVAACLSGAASVLMCASTAVAEQTFYQQRNLVSDGFIPADHVDPSLVNPWGIAFNPTGVWWINDNHSDQSTLYTGTGAINPLVVSIPGAGGAPGEGSPTGIVFSGSSDFVVSEGLFQGPARFIFASEDGTISGWNPAVPPPAPATVAHLAVDNSASGAIYKGLALVNTSAGNRLYATDFHNGKIDVFDGQFHAVTTPGGFVDHHIPDGFAPFGIANIGGKLYVSFAKQNEDAEDDVAGKHLGFVDVFNSDGVLLKRLIKRGRLNAPWGMALAPANFGRFSNMLLIGNFGDGRINAYDPQNGHFKGILRGPNHHPVEIEGLWGLAFGNGLDAGPTNVLFFTAGPDDEEHGLFGSLMAVSGHGFEPADDENGDD